MSDHRCWLVVELADDGDSDVVRQGIVGDCAAVTVGQRETVVAALVDAFDDPVDANAPDRRASSPRDAALRALHELVSVEPELVANHVDAVAGFFDDERRWVPNRAEDLLVDLHEAGATSEADLPRSVSDTLDDR